MYRVKLCSSTYSSKSIQGASTGEKLTSQATAPLRQAKNENCATLELKLHRLAVIVDCSWTTVPESEEPLRPEQIRRLLAAAAAAAAKAPVQFRDRLACWGRKKQDTEGKGEANFQSNGVDYKERTAQSRYFWQCGVCDDSSQNLLRGYGCGRVGASFELSSIL